MVDESILSCKVYASEFGICIDTYKPCDYEKIFDGNGKANNHVRTLILNCPRRKMYDMWLDGKLKSQSNSQNSLENKIKHNL